MPALRRQCSSKYSTFKVDRFFSAGETDKMESAVVLTEDMLRSVLQSVKKILISNSSVLLSPCFHQTWNVSIMWSRDCFPTLSNVLSYIHWSRYKKSEDSTQNSILTKQYIMSSLPSRISHTNVLPWPLVSDALFKHC